MVKFITDKLKLKFRMERMYRTELLLARNLIDIFNDKNSDLHRDLNELVSKALKHLSQQPEYGKALDAAIKDEEDLTLWKKYGKTAGGVRLASIDAAAGALTAPDCSDLIRLMGTLVEKGADKNLQWAKDELKLKDGIRAPAPVPRNKEGRPLPMALTTVPPIPEEQLQGKSYDERKKLVAEWEQKQRQAMVWGQKGKEFKDTQGLAGGRWQKQGARWVDQDAGKNVFQGRVRDKPDAPDQKLEGFSGMMEDATKRGMLIREAKPWLVPLIERPDKTKVKDQTRILQSVVGKMERVFGFPVMGADISGTTGDSTYVVRRFTQYTGKDVDPVMFLLPFATIVAGGHHHLLEVAGTLTLYGTINYTIGLYDTIRPKNPSLKKSRYQSEVTKIDAALAQASRNAQRILVYWKDSEPVGAVELESKDWEAVAQLAPAGGASLWDLFLRVSPSPTLEDLRDLLMNRGCTQAGMEIQKSLAPVSIDAHSKITPKALEDAKRKLRHVETRAA